MAPLIVVDSKYQFVPPHRGTLWPRLLRPVVLSWLKYRQQITRIDVQGAERIDALRQAGQGVLLTPNHCRMTDALVLQRLSAILDQPFYTMASSHLFRGGQGLAWTLRRMGGFSVYREGIDKQAIQTAVDILARAERPLVIFPEGALSQANDHLQPLQEGVSFIARTAAARVAKEQDQSASAPRRIYTVPIAIRYLFQGDGGQTVGTILSGLESRLGWQPARRKSLVERVTKVGDALLTLQEIEHLGSPQAGPLEKRLQSLIDHLLQPLETEWLRATLSGSVIGRVKDLRRVIVPDMIDGDLTGAEMRRRWEHLLIAEFAQALSLYPARYVASHPTTDRLLETVERFEEQLTGQAPVHGPRRVIIDVGEPLLVDPRRDRAAVTDPLLQSLTESLTGLLSQSANHSRLYTSAS
jgi:1-acyl-sn-glycerol-3-phosphate acyltransferase